MGGHFLISGIIIVRRMVLMSRSIGFLVAKSIVYAMCLSMWILGAFGFMYFFSMMREYGNVSFQVFSVSVLWVAMAWYGIVRVNSVARSLILYVSGGLLVWVSVAMLSWIIDEYKLNGMDKLFVVFLVGVSLFFGGVYFLGRAKKRNSENAQA